MARLLRLQQLPLLMHRRKLRMHLRLQCRRMVLPQLPLHLRIHHPRPDRNTHNIRLFLPKTQSQMIHRSLRRPVKSPATIRRDTRTRTRKHNATLTLPQRRQRRRDKRHQTEEIHLIPLLPLLNIRGRNLPHLAQDPVVQDQPVQPPKGLDGQFDGFLCETEVRQIPI